MDIGKGYGKKLFELFIEQVKKEGFHSLKIETHEGNAIMRHLIILYGFDFCGRVILTPKKIEWCLKDYLSFVFL